MRKKASQPDNSFLILFFILALILSAGCQVMKAENDRAPAPAASGTGKATVENDISPAPSKLPLPEEKDGGDEEEDTSNLEDLYIRIYGDDHVTLDGEIPRFDTLKAYGDLSGLGKADLEKAHSSLMKSAGVKIKSGKTGDAAADLRKAAYIEKQSGINDLDSAQKAIGKYGNTAFQKALRLVKLGKYREAAAPAETALFFEPCKGEYLKLAGEIFSLTGEEGMAIPCLVLALEKNPHDYRLQHKLSTIYMVEGSFEKALPLINKDSARYGRTGVPCEDIARAWLGIYLKNPDMKKEAGEKIQKALEDAISARSSSALANNELLMNLALFRGKYGEAAGYCKAMLKLKAPYPIKTRLIYNIALLAHLTGNMEDSRKMLEETIRRVEKGEGNTQGENYMALMSAWILDITGVTPFTSGRAQEIYSHAIKMDHSYRQEFGFVTRFLEAREKKDYDGAILALKDYVAKRHLEPVGDFAQDLLQVPAQKSLIFISLACMYREKGEEKKAENALQKAEESIFGKMKR